MTLPRIISAVMLLLISLQAQAGISSQVDRTTLQQGETLLLVLDVTDNDSKSIDLLPLEQDFEILGRNHRSSTSILNGEIKSFSKLLITLAPKNTGRIEIPALTLGSDKSEPITINVTPVKMASAVDGGVELLSTLSDTTPLVQQPLIYQVNIVLGQRIFNAEFVEPKVRKGKALIQPLGEQRQYRQQLQGRNIMVVEQSWVITPQQSGPLEIESAKLSASVPAAQSRSMRPGNSRALQRLFLRADDYVLDVQPIPGTFSGKNWITANSLKWEDELSSDEWKVGEPVTRRIKLTAEGTSQDQFSELQFPEVTGLKQYSDKPKFEQGVGDNSIELDMMLEVTVIPSLEGTVTLPEIRLPWWNTQTNQEEVAILEARTFNVAPGEFSTSQQSAALNPTIAQPTEVMRPQVLNQNPQQNHTSAQTVQQEPGLWEQASWLIVGVALLLGGGLGSWITLFITRKTPTAETPQVTPQVKSFSLSGLKKACKKNDAKAAREELTAWAHFNFPECKQLNSVLDKVSPELREAMTELNRCCFAESSNDWDGGELYRLVAGFKAEHQSGEKERLVGLVPG